MDFSIAIKQARQECYMSQSEFADQIEVSFTTVNRWETGKAYPNYKTMKRLIAYLKQCNVAVEDVEDSWKRGRQNG
jgi:putative transcriptional regulator